MQALRKLEQAQRSSGTNAINAGTALRSFRPTLIVPVYIDCCGPHSPNILLDKGPMLVFIYEFVTGGGWWSADPRNGPTGSLLDEGGSMVRALASDFSTLADVQVCCLCDSRIPPFHDPRIDVTRVISNEARDSFLRLATRADYSVVIAPEFDGFLLERVGWAEQVGARLLSPGHDFVSLASDKHATASWLARHGIRTPRGTLWKTGDPLPTQMIFPAVVKPRDGAGSRDVRLLATKDALAGQSSADQLLIEEYCPGMAASVAFLSGPAGYQVLPPCRQLLSQDGRFSYLGGEAPLAADFWPRAGKLARSVAAAFPKTTGYAGIDVVFGDAEDGSQDVVIEVNPRLTTSYIGLRRISRVNLASAMLGVARGEAVELSFDAQPITFCVGSG